MRVVYLAGPFRALTPWGVEQNVRRAETIALSVWRLGAACLCPHTNTRFFDGSADDAVWLAGDLEMLSRCDAVLLTIDWRNSKGATAEREFALARGLPVFEQISDLAEWLTPLTRIG